MPDATMPDTLTTPLPRGYGAAESYGGGTFSGVIRNSRVRVVRLNMRSSVARAWAKGKLVTLRSTPNTVLGEAWYERDVYGNLVKIGR